LPPPVPSPALNWINTCLYHLSQVHTQTHYILCCTSPEAWLDSIIVQETENTFTSSFCAARFVFGFQHCSRPLPRTKSVPQHCGIHYSKMTAPLAQQVVPVKDSAAIRKRRRRAPAGGASDDCFTCSKRNVKCDRRRPYCSQCLEVGNECSGYKTQLTWNVGVASRGKLRGLSLPVAKAPPVPREPKRSPARSRAHTASISAPQRWVDGESSAPVAPCQPIDIPSVAVASAPTTPYGAAGFDYLSIGNHDHHPSIHQHSWGAVSAFSAGGMVHSPDVTPKYSRFPFPLVTDNLSSSMGSVGSVTSDVDYMSPVSQSYPREEIPFMHSPTIMYDGFPASQGSPIAHSPPSGPTVDYTRAPTSCPSLVYAPSETSSSLHSQIDVFETHLNQKLMHEADHFSEHVSVPFMAYPF
jgi:hypothetical protein